MNLQALIIDSRYAFRMFFKNPGMTLLAILALAISMGMATTLFSVINGLFFKPPPYPNAHELYQIGFQQEGKKVGSVPVPGNLVKLMEKESQTLENLFPYYVGTVNVSGEGVPERLEGGFVGGSFLSVLGVELFLGEKEILRDKETVNRGVLLGYDFWVNRYRSADSIIGTTIRVNGEDRKVLGVMPEGFSFPAVAQVWIPFTLDRFDSLESIHPYFAVVARKRAGVSTDEISAELMKFSKGYDLGEMDMMKGAKLAMQPFGDLELDLYTKRYLVITFVAIFLILLVACANVANLLVGRALSREREMAIRSAMGASRGRIMQQMLTESLILSSLGALGGVVDALWAIDGLMNSGLWQMPAWKSFSIDWRVVVFVVGLALFTGGWSGILPSIQASRIPINEALKASTRSVGNFKLGRFTRGLSVVQIALSFALLVGAGITMRHVYLLANFDPGYRSDEILTMRMGLFENDYPDAKSKEQFYQNVLEEVQALPEVRSASFSSWLGNYGNSLTGYEVLKANSSFLSLKQGYDERRELRTVYRVVANGEMDEDQMVYTEAISPSHFKTLGIKMIAGRSFSESQKMNEIVINETFAEILSGGSEEPVLGRMIHFDEMRKPGEMKVIYQIVGIVENVTVSNFTEVDRSEPIAYTNYKGGNHRFLTLMVASSRAEDDRLFKDIQRVILANDPNLPLYFVGTKASFIEKKILPYKILANLFVWIGLMALFLAGLGVYGMIAFGVRTKRREIGIRMALGARSEQIVALVLRQGVWQIALGMISGMVLAILLVEVSKGHFVGMEPWEVDLFLAAFLVLSATSLLAFFLPMRRAVQLSPLQAIRFE